MKKNIKKGDLVKLKRINEKDDFIYLHEIGKIGIIIKKANNGYFYQKGLDPCFKVYFNNEVLVFSNKDFDKL